jgi:hypothetical protein
MVDGTSGAVVYSAASVDGGGGSRCESGAVPPLSPGSDPSCWPRPRSGGKAGAASIREPGNSGRRSFVPGRGYPEEGSRSSCRHRGLFVSGNRPSAPSRPSALAGRSPGMPRRYLAGANGPRLVPASAPSSQSRSPHSVPSWPASRRMLTALRPAAQRPVPRSPGGWTPVAVTVSRGRHRCCYSVPLVHRDGQRHYVRREAACPCGGRW